MKERRITLDDGRFVWVGENGTLRTTLEEYRKTPEWRKNLECLKRIRERYEAKVSGAADVRCCRGLLSRESFSPAWRRPTPDFFPGISPDD